jgi:dTDP-4-dehydrorhamnose reductase
LSRIKVLILGASGLIGHQLFFYLKSFDKYEVYAVSKSQMVDHSSVLMDVLKKNNLKSCIKNTQPELVINCIGALINISEENPEMAHKLNAELPHVLSQLSKELNFRLIHISTDCVFSGNSSKPYTEIDLPDGASTYAITKAIGEEIKNEHLVVRTSVIGPELSNRTEELFNWFMSQNHEVEGYQTAIWSGVTTLILARSIEELINKDLIGIYHVTNNSSISKHHLLELLKRQTEKEISIIPVNKNNSDKSFVDTRLQLKLTIPSYEQMIIEMVEFIRANNQRYNLYHLK